MSVRTKKKFWVKHCAFLLDSDHQFSTMTLVFIHDTKRLHTVKTSSFSRATKLHACAIGVHMVDIAANKLYSYDHVRQKSSKDLQSRRGIHSQERKKKEKNSLKSKESGAYIFQTETQLASRDACIRIQELTVRVDSGDEKKTVNCQTYGLVHHTLQKYDELKD